ncbi:hypothetical protein BpHYR1_048415 [Brachionus plicatilis]|uniref:Uncharacterized protein n=1 Tax=Brachionus plicatilis TaxID=10195 RepID=A0A3M7Q6U6_BRAPC|nr:hypothetical protein BpHYR1_048415 [Brachionus plicatilis]
MEFIYKIMDLILLKKYLNDKLELLNKVLIEQKTKEISKRVEKPLGLSSVKVQFLPRDSLLLNLKTIDAELFTYVILYSKLKEQIVKITFVSNHDRKFKE